MPRLQLYFAPGACSFVPHCLLEASGAEFEPRLVKLHKRENDEAPFRAVNPRGQVPVLVHGEQTITQILAIVGYLDALFPEHRFLPGEPLARARAMELLAWMNNTVHPTFTHVFMPFKYSDDADVQAQLKSFNAGQYRKLLQELQDTVAQAGAATGGWLGGAAFGPLDAYALTLTRWGTIAGIDPEGLPLLWAYVQRVAQEPAVARAMQRERLQLNLYTPPLA
ncbi:glutathione S-transferase family protein [Pseudorhodoferax sp. Leaf267]|uniref:glutathione S-transferase family protein n=1 Tax=Pseudorhodoferax sp. Leaf267 TaxID=1736316 RepID=UPI0006F9685B|nr:glutathione S-transferase N-terminal domain-containing protein [Pseudorhodoferax sp. Leaf267]KQP12198.1 glutathione S-transferase [Pseudorhodoferax sp. Leaf267]